MMNDIPAQLWRMRTAKGQTLAEVAAGTGLSISYLSNLERGRANPSIETLEKILAYHHMKLFIFFVEDTPNTVPVPYAALHELQCLIERIFGEQS